MRQYQKGQAVVLIAIMLAVVVGMAALAVDGAHAYALRRDLQAAVDAAALAAGDKLQQTGSYTGAEQAASTIFGTNLRLYTSSCTPYGSPGAAPLTVTCTYSGGTVLTEVVSALGPQGSQFTMNATRSLDLQFARILTNGTIPNLAATASSGVNNQLYSPTLAALSTAGCGGSGGGSGSAISVISAGTLTVIGDMVSNGVISVAGTALVAGDVYARCQSPVTGVSTVCFPSGNPTPCTFPDVAGTTKTGYRFSDPGYPPPPVTGPGRGAPGIDVVLSPGIYAADPNLSTHVCYFLSAGVYEWQAGYTNGGDFVSNELKPPDEPSPASNTTLAKKQFWNSDSANCGGSFQLTSTSGTGIKEGTWAVELTSARTDVYAGTNYRRESAPSICKTVTIGDAQVIKLQISNVPGATSYYVYAAPPNSGCSGPFGFAGSIPVVGSVQNNSTGICPIYSGSGCSLGNETALLDTTILGAPFAPNPLAAPDTLGAYPPDGETQPVKGNLPNGDPPRGPPPAGDRANENECNTIVGVLASCPAAVTPGAVVFYIPSGGCLNDTSSGDNFLFSGYQDNWIMVYEPGAANPPANTCSNLMAAATDSALVGLVYIPAAAVTVQKASTFRADATGGVIANTITFTGQLPTIIFNSGYAPTPPAGKLVS